MESVQARVQEAVNKMINQLDREHLRKMQSDMYKCSAKCCENEHYNMEDAQRCVEKCSIPINQTQQLLGNELQSLQDRLQRCAMDCQDKARDRMGPGTNEADVAKYRSLMEKCVVKCADDHVALIPSMTKRIKDSLKKK